MREALMREAIGLSREAVETGAGGPFGAVVVLKGEILGRGNNKVLSANDPTAHAEIIAIREACKKHDSYSLKGAELYTSCEPCPMCLAAIYWARIEKVYYANSREDATEIAFDDELIYQELSRSIPDRKIVMKQLLRAEALSAFELWKKKADKTVY